MSKLSVEEREWLQSRLHSDPCKQCDLVRRLLAEEEA